MEVLNLRFLRVFSVQFLSFFAFFIAQIILIAMCFGVYMGAYLVYIIIFALLLSSFLSASLSVGKAIAFNEKHMVFRLYSLGFLGLVKKTVLLSDVTNFKVSRFFICVESKDLLSEFERVYIPKMLFTDSQVKSVCVCFEKYITSKNIV